MTARSRSVWKSSLRTSPSALTVPLRASLAKIPNCRMAPGIRVDEEHIRARLALRRSIGLETYPETSAQYTACDVTKDKKAGTDDARYILRHAIGLKDPKIW